MKKYALFLGCNIPAHLKHYETSAGAVLGKLGIELVDIPEFNCCGYPLRNINHNAFVMSSARNLALAEKKGLDLMPLCQCGYGTLRMADYFLSEDPLLREEVNQHLSKEGLSYAGEIEINHLLSVLFRDVGVKEIKKNIIGPMKISRLPFITIATPSGRAMLSGSTTQFPRGCSINLLKPQERKVWTGLQGSIAAEGRCLD